MRYALLTGVGRPGQVGEAVASRLASDGFSLLLVDRDRAVEERATDLRAKGATAQSFTADLSSEDSVADLMAAFDRAGVDGLDAVVHLAGGFAVTGPVADTQLADWDKQLTINLRTAFLVARSVVPLLRARKGSLVFFSSESALDGAKVARISAYAVAKTGVRMLGIAISQEEAANGVRVNVVAPAAIRTAANVADMGPSAKFVEREDVAATVAWLCSQEAVAVTGQVLRLAPR